MAVIKTLDLNNLDQPLMRLNLKDGSALDLTVPTEALVQELQGMAPKLKKIAEGKRDGLADTYDLTARLMSCNTDRRTFTVDDLRPGGEHYMNLAALIMFFSAYLEFITALTNEKN